MPDYAEFTEDADGVGELELHCPRCDALIKPGAARCPACGERLEAEAYAIYRPAPTRLIRIIAWSALVLMVLVPLVLAIWAFLARK